MSLISIVSELEFHLAYNYALCYFVTTITTGGQMIGDIVFDLDWYQLPSAGQQFSRMVMHRSQKVIKIKGLGVFVCSLETFLKVRIQLSIFYAKQFNLWFIFKSEVTFYS